jgi:hypothetical protein
MQLATRNSLIILSFYLTLKLLYYRFTFHKSLIFEY